MDITLILHHGGCLERDEYRRLNYVRGEICVWEKMVVDVLSLWDIEKTVKHCRGYFKVSKLWYFKPFKSDEEDLNICLNPLTTNKDFLDMVKVARANGNEVDIYAQHVVDTSEVEIVPLSSEEREELERVMEESLRSMQTQAEPCNVMDVDILTAEERSVIESLVANVQNRVGDEEDNVGNVGATQETQATQVDTVGATQATQETQPQETVTQQETHIEENVTRKGVTNSGQKKEHKKGKKNKL
ncbi:hypothetical protein MTR_4g094228 [Medicago truncatula]|uniref:PB1-like domain-containing protein n=1 Tax=Medicago truncatula TaxID=3880 RepID=A0A072UND8_MEDTR|nr:hypothetical protein MTR_4g094228 [Medicago truncatula]